MKRLITVVIIFISGTFFAQENLSYDITNSHTSKSTVQRKVILENFTSNNCHNCPPVHILLENYMETQPNVIIIAQHAGFGTDVFTIPENTELLALFNESTYCPALAIDRHHYSTGLIGGAPDPGPVFFPGEDHSATTARIDDRLALPSNISLDITYTNNAGVIDLDIQGEILENVNGNDLRLVVYIIEDKLIANQSGGSSDYEHNNVMRDAISETWGDAGIITSNTSGTTFSKQYSYTPDPTWILNNLSVVSFVANYDTGNVNNREILQADRVYLAQTTGTNNVAFANSLIYPNPTSSELIVENAEGLNASIFDILGRELLTKKNISIKERINISDFAEGTYLLTLSDGNKIRTEKIIIK